MEDDCLYESNNEYEIPNLLLEKQAGKLLLPLIAYSSFRPKSNAQTVHFYVDDYRFNGIWKNPAKILNSRIIAAAEPNTSLFYTTPIAYGLHQIYKKRWIARYWQECGMIVYGGGEKVKSFCIKNSLLYIHDLMTPKNG